MTSHELMEEERNERPHLSTTRGQKRRESPGHEMSSMKRVELPSGALSKRPGTISDAAVGSRQALQVKNSTEPEMIAKDTSHPKPTVQDATEATEGHCEVDHIDDDSECSIDTAKKRYIAAFDEGDRVASEEDWEPISLFEASLLFKRRFPFVSTDPAKRRRWLSGFFFSNLAAGLVTGGYFPELCRAITKFTATRMPTRTLSWGELDSQFRVRVEAITPEARNYVTTGPMNLRNFADAWIWRLLWDNLLSPDCVDKWNGASWASFGTMVRDFRANVCQEDSDPTIAFHRMRYSSARLLYMIHGYQSDHVRLRSILQDQLRPLIRMSGMDTDVAEQALYDIAVAAIRFDLVILGAKTDIHVDIRDPSTKKFWGFEHQPESRLYDGTGQFKKDVPGGMAVDLVVRPWMRIFGNRNVNFPDSEVISNYGHCEHMEPIHVQRGFFFSPRYMDEALAREKSSTSQSGEGNPGTDERVSKKASAVAPVKRDREVAEGYDDDDDRGNKSDGDDSDEDENENENEKGVKKKVKNIESDDNSEEDDDEVDVEMESDGSEKNGGGKDGEDEDGDGEDDDGAEDDSEDDEVEDRGR